jgi:hypothetical protein
MRCAGDKQRGTVKLELPAVVPHAKPTAGDREFAMQPSTFSQPLSYARALSSRGLREG